MVEESIHLRSGEWEMHGLYHGGDLKQGGVITHPHPLHGSDMFNPVVEAIFAAFRQSGFAGQGDPPTGTIPVAPVPSSTNGMLDIEADVT